MEISSKCIDASQSGTCHIPEEQQTRLARKGKTGVSEEALKAVAVPGLFLGSFCLALPIRCVNSADLPRAEAAASHRLMMGVKSCSAALHNSTRG